MRKDLSDQVFAQVTSMVFDMDAPLQSQIDSLGVLSIITSIEEALDRTLTQQELDLLVSIGLKSLPEFLRCL